MFMTQSQLAASVRIRQRDAMHASRMKEDEAYRERIERESREYDEYIKRFGPPIHHQD